MNALNRIRFASDVLSRDSVSPACMICHETNRKTCCVRDQMLCHLALRNSNNNVFHYFHKSCIESWMNTIQNPNCKKCPLCKKVLNRESLEQTRSIFERGWQQIKKGSEKAIKITQDIAQSIFHGLWTTGNILLVSTAGLTNSIPFDFYIYPCLNLGLLGLTEALVNHDLLATLSASVSLERTYCILKYVSSLILNEETQESAFKDAISTYVRVGLWAIPLLGSRTLYNCLSVIRTDHQDAELERRIFLNSVQKVQKGINSALNLHTGVYVTTFALVILLNYLYRDVEGYQSTL